MSALSRPRAHFIKLARRGLGIRQLNHLTRFEPVLTQIESAAGNEATPTLLDVGGGSDGITTLLAPHWQATVLDASFEDYAPGSRRGALAPNQVLGDARDLPFETGSFDVVVAVDLLEHVSPTDRAVLLQRSVG